MGCLWSALRLYCSPPWCHKMDDVITVYVSNINSIAVEWLLLICPSKTRGSIKIIISSCRRQVGCKHCVMWTLEIMLGDWYQAVIAWPAFLKGKIKMKGEPHQKYLSAFSPCNTGNPNQNYQVCTLHTNYRHEIHTTLQLVAGVIFAPTPSLILILCLLILQSG